MRDWLHEAVMASVSFSMLGRTFLLKDIWITTFFCLQLFILLNQSCSHSRSKSEPAFLRTAGSAPAQVPMMAIMAKRPLANSAESFFLRTWRLGLDSLVKHSPPGQSSWVGLNP